MTRTEYHQYLKSDHWRNLRLLKLGKSSRRCAICASISRLEIHHLQYKNITDVDTADLRVLCNRCHGLFHLLKREGKIKLKPGSHHSLFAQTKHHVKVAIGLTKPKLHECSIQQRLKSYMTPNGGFTKDTLGSMGVPWPPPKGWVKYLRISEDGRLQYLHSSHQESNP